MNFTICHLCPAELKELEHGARLVISRHGSRDRNSSSHGVTGRDWTLPLASSLPCLS